MAKKIRVLIVDDSALIRQFLSHLLSQDQNIEVVGAAHDPTGAWKKIEALRPDVITLDIVMPHMDGLTFLEKLMTTTPMPVLMVSSLTEQGCETALRALELGAVDIVTKPKVDICLGMEELAEELIEKVKAAAIARVRGKAYVATPKIAPSVVRRALHAASAMSKTTDTICRISVKEAEDGDSVLPGYALIAPGNYHMTLVRSGARYLVRLNQDPPVNRHRPSVDVTFASVAKHAGGNSIGIILTGMGDDGAAGLLQMKQSGAYTIAQNESTCVVFGMPKEAIQAGAVDVVLPLGDIPNALLRHLREGGRRAV